jgi:DNA-binding response OmpR family regulator
MVSILIIDDDVELCRMLSRYLLRHGMHLESRDNGQSGLETALAGKYDIVLLDLMLPAMEGLEVLRHIRMRSDVCILLLTALGADADRIKGLEHGADDYLPKPFNPLELVARIRAILRRAPSRLSSHDAGAKPSLQLGGFFMDFSSLTVRYKDEILDLTDIEFLLLEVLLRSAGSVVNREDLVRRVFDRPFHPLDRGLDMQVSRLRRKLERVDELRGKIKTVRSAGYLMVLPVAGYTS